MIASRSRIPVYYFWTALAFLSFAATSRAQFDPVPFGEIVIRALPSPRPNFDNGGGHGNIEYRFSVKNNSAKREHLVTIQYPYENEFLRIEKTIKVGPGDKAEIALFQPTQLSVGYGGARVLIDGQPQAQVVPVNGVNVGWHGHGAHLGQRMKRIIAPERMINDLQSRVHLSAAPLEPKSQRDPKFTDGIRVDFMPGDGKLESFRTSDGQEYHYEHLHTFSPYGQEELNDWSSNWLAYTCVDGIVVRGGKLNDVAESVRNALFQYVECGGTLVVVGSTTAIPEAWQKTTEKLADMTGYSPGFGRCLVVKNETIEKWEPKQWAPIVDAINSSAGPFMSQHDMYSANSIFTVVESFGIPVRGLFMVMLIFAVVIGPVNMYLLGRTKRRIWLLWTVPVISLATCVAVFLYMYSVEGWFGHSRTEGFTVLDEARNRASSVGWTAFYSPLTPYDGLHFDQGTELSPQISDDREEWGPYGRRRQQAKHRTVDWTNDQHLQTGWVSARLPMHFKFRRSEHRLERLVVNKEAGGHTVTNGLKGRIKRLWVADEKGVIATAENISPGSTATLSKTATKAVGKLSELRDVFHGDWANVVNAIPAAPEDTLRPGTYLAEMEGAPFLPSALAGARKREASLVFGIMKEPIHAH